MNQLRKAKSRNRRRHAVLPRKYIKVVVTYVLLFAIVFSNMSNPLLNVFAGQKKEEFRIHADELQRAAEEALEEGNIVEEPLDFYTKDSSLLKEYEELFAADGTLYEIFPDYEREYYLDDIELRIFLRISPDADPDSYALTGEETLIFLYTNGGEETVAGRVNIDGYISGICSLKSYMTAFEKKENSGSHNSGNSSSSGTKTEPGIDPSEAETAEEVPGTDQDPTDDGEKNSQVDSETEEVKEPEASDTGKNDDEDKSHEDGSGAENSNTENNGSDNEENPDTEDENDASENTPDENQEENTSDNENSEDTGSDNEDQGEDSSSSDTVASISIHSRIFLTDTMQEETEEETEAPTEEETEKETEPETESETETEPEKETSAEATEPETDPVPEETTPKETTADETLPQETPEETTATESKDNTGTTETGAAAQPETEETTAAAAGTEGGTLIVGFDQDFPPMGFLGDNNEYTGFDLELAQEVAKRLGLEYQAQPIAWDAKDMELESGNIDCIWNGFTMTGREDDYTWTEPYMENTQVFVVRNDSGIEGKDGLAGKVVECQADSSAEAALKEDPDLTATFGQLLTTADYNTAFMDLQQGSVDAIAMDVIVAGYQIQQRKADFKILDDSLSAEEYGVGFKKGNTELRDKVQAALEDMAKDGTLKEISEKWFGEDVTTIGK